MQASAWRERAAQSGAFVDHAPVDPTGAAYVRAVPAAPKGPLQGRTFAAKVRMRLEVVLPSRALLVQHAARGMARAATV